MVLVRNTHDGAPGSTAYRPLRQVRDAAPSAKASTVKVVPGSKVVVTVQPPEPKAPVLDQIAATLKRIKDVASPYQRYSKGQYRIEGDGDQWRVDMWGNATNTWKEMTNLPKAQFRVEETPVDWLAFRLKPGEDAPTDPSETGPVMDRAATAARLKDQRLQAEAQIVEMNAKAKARWANPGKDAA